MELYRELQSKNILVSGLTWRALDPFDSAHNQIARFIADGNKWSVKFKNGNDQNYGLGMDFNPESIPGCSIYSLGALAAIDQNFQGGTVLLLLENTISPDQGGIAIGILAGNVILDRQFDLEAADSIIEDFSKICGKASRSYQLWGNVYCSLRQYDKPYSLADLADPKKKGFKASRILPLKTERTTLVVIASIGIIVLLAFASMGWEIYSEDQKAAMDAIRKIQNSPTTQYQNAANIFLEQEHFLTSTTTKEISEQIDAFPIIFKGWQFTEAVCDIPKCRVKWKSVGGTYSDFRDNAPAEWTNIAMTDATDSSGIGDLKTLMSDFPMKLTAERLKPKNEWPKLDDFLWATGEWLQKLSAINWKASLKQAQIQEIPPSISPQSIASSPNVIWGIPWAVTSQPWWMINAIQKSMGNTATYKKMTIKYDEKLPAIVFNAEGVVYVQK